MRALLLLGLAAVLVFAAYSMPEFGSFPYRLSGIAVSDYYINNAVNETGAANVVATIVWLYRGYDTLGESTILFTSVIGILLLSRWKK